MLRVIAYCVRYIKERDFCSADGVEKWGRLWEEQIESEKKR